MIVPFFAHLKRSLNQFTGASLWAVPIALLLLCVVSFGLFIPWLGFYWDDWPVLLTSRLFGADGLWKFYQYDRPASAWTYIVTLPILGYTPWAWQGFSLLLRWATAAMVWLTVRGTWPERKREAAWVALLFTVYPVFAQQSISVAYSQHWFSYLFLMFSLAAMLWAVRRPKLFWWLTIPALAAVVLHTITMEYFVGLELLRPLLLWIVFRDLLQEQPESKVWIAQSQEPTPWPPPEAGGGRRNRGGWRSMRAANPHNPWRRTWLPKKASDFEKTIELKETPRRRLAFFYFKHWFPYVLLLGFTMAWRFLHITFPEGGQANPPILLYQLLQNPLQAVLRLLQIAVQDVIYIVFSVWAKLIDPAQFDLIDRFYVFSTAAAIVSALAAVFLLTPWRNEATQPPVKPRRPWYSYALWLGLAAMLLGILPVWLTERQIMRGSYSDRFILAGMFGVSLVMIAVLEWLTAYNRQKALVLVILISISVGTHMRTANDFRWGWVKQTRFYWQLAWRAPAIQPNTAIFSDGEIFPYVGLYSTSAAINLMYPNPAPTEVLPYYFYSLGRSFMHQMPAFQAGIALGKPDFRNYNFQGNTRDGLVIYYEPKINDCLHVLSPDDTSIPDLPEVTGKALPNANLSRIQSGPLPPGYPPSDIFGPEPEHGWCYFFQKADLARQMGDWTQVAELGDEVAQQGYAMSRSDSNTPYEWLPFIEGYARVGRWQEAERIADEVLGKDKRLDVRVCQIWNKLGDDPLTSEVGRQKSEVLLREYGCR